MLAGSLLSLIHISEPTRLLSIVRDRDGGLSVTGRAWQEDGTLSARYWSEAAKERKDPAGILYFWKGERPRAPNAPQLEGCLLYTSELPTILRV